MLILIVSEVSAQQYDLSSTKESSSSKAQKSIRASTASSGKNQIFYDMLEATDFGVLLDRSGPFTVFIPSDFAFQNILGTSVTELQHPDNKEELKAFIGYYIVAGNLSASNILKALSSGKGITTFTTLQGDIITVTMNGLDIVLSDSYGSEATIIVADSEQRNGVIHEIDGIIEPNKL